MCGDRDQQPTTSRTTSWTTLTTFTITILRNITGNTSRPPIDILIHGSSSDHGYGRSSQREFANNFGLTCTTTKRLARLETPIQQQPLRRGDDRIRVFSLLRTRTTVAIPPSRAIEIDRRKQSLDPNKIAPNQGGDITPQRTEIQTQQQQTQHKHHEPRTGSTIGHERDRPPDRASMNGTETPNVEPTRTFFTSRLASNASPQFLLVFPSPFSRLSAGSRLIISAFLT